MVSINNCSLGEVLEVKMPLQNNTATVVEKPFYDPKKKLTNS